MIVRPERPPLLLMPSSTRRGRYRFRSGLMGMGENGVGPPLLDYYFTKCQYELIKILARLTADTLLPLL